MSVALLDGDIIAYRAAIAAQEDIDWGDGEDGLTVDTRSAIYNGQTTTKRWIEMAGADSAILCLSCEDRHYFRHDLLPTYKGGRSNRPEAYDAVLKSLAEDYPIKMLPHLEADDVMGILATSPKFTDSVIVSLDKDMKTIPGRLLNPLKDKKPRLIKLRDADHFWMMQTLMGDRVDGYEGLPNVGPVRAEKILMGARNLKQMWKLVVMAYQAAGLTEEDALLQARLARILRREDYDKETEAVTLWHPKNNLKN